MGTIPYGLAIEASASELPFAGGFSRLGRGCLSRTSANGVVLVVRRYAATPEAVAEEQPVADDNVVLAYEGRVDNRREIAYLLGQPQLAGRADGAVLAAAFEAWGASLSARVIGEYAYVVFDRRTRRLVAGQDSLGVRRIYYGARGDRVWITSNLRLLFEQFPEARPPLEREVLREYFAGTMAPWSGRTIWCGIRELGRGSVLVQRGDDFEEQIVWTPDPGRRVRFRTEEEVDEAFRALLFEAVDGALRSPGPVLCDLSGGYDSSTVCSVAALLATNGEGRRPLLGWSTVNNRTDEIRFQDAVRAQHQIDLHVLDIDECLPFQIFDDCELPTGGFIQCGAMNRAVRAFAQAREVRSRLTGYGADALLSKGFPPPMYLSEWLRQGRVRDWARDCAAYLKSGSYSAWHLLWDCTVGTLDLHAGGLRAPLPDWLTPRFREEIRQANHDFLALHHRSFASVARERVYRLTLCFIPLHGELLPDERMPLVYRPLVEFLLGLDWEHLARPGLDRVLMRRALRGILPETVREGGATSHHGESLLKGLRTAWPRISHLLRGDHLAELGVVEAKPFRAALNRIRAGYRGPNVRCSNTALYLETWLGFKADSRNTNLVDGMDGCPSPIDASPRQPRVCSTPS